MQVGWAQIAIVGDIAGYRSITCWKSATTTALFTAQSATHASVKLYFITDCSMHDHDEEKNLRSTSCTIKATDRDKASRGLSATAGLLVCLRKLKAAGPRSRLLAYCDHFMGPKHQSFRNNFGRPQPIWIKICTGQQAIRFRKF